MEAKRLVPAEPEAFRLALRVRHPSLDPTELSRAFRIEPEYSYRAGSVRTSRNSTTPASVYSESYWVGKLAATDQSFAGTQRIAQRQLAMAKGNLTWALALSCGQFLKAQADLLRSIRAEGGEVTLLVTICSDQLDSFSLAPEASRIFGELGVGIEFEIANE